MAVNGGQRTLGLKQLVAIAVGGMSGGGTFSVMGSAGIDSFAVLADRISRSRSLPA